MHNYCEVCNARINYGAVGETRPLHERLHLQPLCDNDVFYIVRFLIDFAKSHDMFDAIVEKQKLLGKRG